MANLDFPLAFGGLTITQIRATQQVTTPVEADTVVCNNPATDLDLWLIPTDSLNAVTIQLPTGFSGMRVNISSTKSIKTVTLTGPANIYNPLTTISPGDSWVMVCGPNMWVHPS